MSVLYSCTVLLKCMTMVASLLMPFILNYSATGCGDPGTPANGIRTLTRGTTLGSVVTYECIEGYSLEGPSSRVCQSSGTWSATLPSCKG